jgi:hypothetical protein
MIMLLPTMLMELDQRSFTVEAARTQLYLRENTALAVRGIPVDI